MCILWIEYHRIFIEFHRCGEPKVTCWGVVNKEQTVWLVMHPRDGESYHILSRLTTFPESWSMSLCYDHWCCARVAPSTVFVSLDFWIA